MGKDDDRLIAAERARDLFVRFIEAQLEHDALKGVGPMGEAARQRRNAVGAEMDAAMGEHASKLSAWAIVTAIAYMQNREAATGSKPPATQRFDD